MAGTCETVAVSGLLTIGTVAAARAALLAAVARSDEILIEVSSETAADIAGVQLIHSSRLLALQMGKKVALQSPAAGALLETLRAAGVLEGSSADERRFWLHEGAV